MAHSELSPTPVEMHRRRITLQDGRYLLFYTFDAETPHTEVNADNSDKEIRQQNGTVNAEAVATEERGV